MTILSSYNEFLIQFIFFVINHYIEQYPIKVRFDFISITTITQQVKEDHQVFYLY